MIFRKLIVNRNVQSRSQNGQAGVFRSVDSSH